MKTTVNSKEVSIIGLGKMGRKLAQLYVDAGFKVTVWNRTSGKSKELDGVQVAQNAEAAILENTLSIICVHDNAATLEILNSLQDKTRLAGKTVLNLTTGSPAEVEELETLLIEYGGYYLNGAIQAAPDQMG